MQIGDLKGMFGLLTVYLEMLRIKLKVLDNSYGDGTANTALIYHGGRLLALHEADKPYAIKVLEDGDLQTLGMLDYDKRLEHAFTAHPKVDPVTGEMFTFGYALKAPFVTYRVISKDGLMHDPVTITIPASVMMHDFAITENYAIFMDLPLYFQPKEMVTKKQFAYKFDATKKARFGVLPRYAKNELLIKWFELPNCFIFHNANAWEEGDEVVMISCRIQNPDLDMASGSVKDSLDFINELYEMRFNMKTGLASQKKLSESAVDFPRVNENYTGRKQRYVYATMLSDLAKVKGIVKFDLHAERETGKTKLEVGGNVEGIFDLGPGRFGSEAIFVPREASTTYEEDDGYLILFVHDENTGKSEVNVIDAKTMSADPVAVVELPNRVPYGFHAFFVNEVSSLLYFTSLSKSGLRSKLLERRRFSCRAADGSSSAVATVSPWPSSVRAGAGSWSIPATEFTLADEFRYALSIKISPPVISTETFRVASSAPWSSTGLKQVEAMRGGGGNQSPAKSSTASSSTATSSEGQAAAGAASWSAEFSPKSLEKHCRPIDDVIMEAEAKGTLIERLVNVEERVAKLCMHLHQELEALKTTKEATMHTTTTTAPPPPAAAHKSPKKGFKSFVKSCVKGKEKGRG
nr:carotenoid 9,10(9',10')-cleavage dioxygenase 1-like [Ipomoea batatas]